MIGQRENIDHRLLIGMDTSYHLYRFIDPFAPAIDFDLIFGAFRDLADLPFEWICARQRTVGTLDRINGDTVIVIPDAPHADLCQFVTDLPGIFPGDENLKLYFHKVIHDIYCLTSFPYPASTRIFPS